MPEITMSDIQTIRRKQGRIDARRYKNFWDYIDDAGRIDLNPKIRLGPFDGITNKWKNKPCLVVGAGPSLKNFDWSRLNNIRSIGINHVIEDYDKFNWFLFLDNRFLKKTTYDIKNYKGIVFCQNNCNPPAGINTVFFKTIKHRGNFDLNINKGLFNGCLSALAALHLALISGADPIYLMGIDCGGTNDLKNYHYKDDYTGAIVYQNNKEKLKKYKGTANYFNKFEKWKKRIINLSPVSEIKTFRKKKIDDIAILKTNKKIQINRLPTICHIIKMSNMEKMGDISRHVFNKGYGNHVFCNINNNNMPKADIYLLECFINDSKKFINFKAPYSNSKIISLIHSSSSCMPAKISNKIIVLTAKWKKILKKRGYDSVVINGAIDVNKYKYEIDYSNKVFGRITRYSLGKVHPKWNEVCKNVLDKEKKSKCIFFTGKTNKLLKHPRFIIDDSIKINEHEKKAKKLSQLSMLTDMHNTFIEIFPMATLEAMASGLALVMYSKANQLSTKEMTGDSAIWCNSIFEFQNKIVELLNDVEQKKEYGFKAKERARQYSIEKMIKQYDDVFKEVLK